MRYTLIAVLLLLFSLSPEVHAQDEPLPEVYSVDWNRDGMYIAVGTEDGFFIYDTGDLSMTPIHFMPGMRVTSVVFHPTEPTWLAVNPRDEEAVVQIIDLDNGETVFQTNWIVDEYTDLSFTADGERLIAVAGGMPVIYPLAEAAQPYLLYALETSDFSVFAVSPDGEQISAVEEAALYIDTLDAPEQTLNRLLDFEVEDEVTAIAFSPDGDVVIAGDERGSLRKWSLPDLTYTSFIRSDRTSTSNYINALEFATETPIFYTAEGDPAATVRVFQIQALNAVDAFGFEDTTARHVLDLALNPDETQIAALLDDNTVHVIDLADKSLVARLGTPLK